MKPNKLRDLFFVTIAPLIIFIGVFAFGWQISCLASLLLVLGIPSLYLSVLNRDKLKKIILYTFTISIPTGIIFDFAVRADNGWFIPKSILPYRLFDLMPLENYIWMFLAVYIIIIFYEHFCNKFEKEISKRLKIFSWIFYTLTALILIVHIIRCSFFIIPYIYLYLGITLFLIPTLFFIWKYPKFMGSFFNVQVYFFYLHIMFELIGVKLQHWVYPGTHYIGIVSFFGLNIPFEEFFFVIAFGAFETLAYYEFFTNRKLK